MKLISARKSPADDKDQEQLIDFCIDLIKRNVYVLIKSNHFYHIELYSFNSVNLELVYIRDMNFMNTIDASLHENGHTREFVRVFLDYNDYNLLILIDTKNHRINWCDVFDAKTLEKKRYMRT